jgi:hypothetical protein
LRRLARSLIVVSVVGGACLPTGTRRLAPLDHGDAGTPTTVVVDGGGEMPGDAPILRPHALLGVDPPHGPFSGGTLTKVRGNGFASNARVWFGDNEVPADSVIMLDTQRLQVTTPPGSVGPSDVVVQNGDDESTRATLEGGFTYDDFYLEPATGPTAGGTIVTIHAQAPLFDDSTEVEVDLAPCDDVEVTSETELTCRTPPGTPGAKLVRVITGDEEPLDVLDAFTYVVSNDGYQGGLSGDKLDGQIEVLVLDNVEGLAIPGATVLAGKSADDVLKTKTDSFGSALIASSTLGSKATITIAKHCFQPQTFVDVPVDKLTVYLDPVLSPACGDSGELPAGGGIPGKSASVSGQLVWPFEGDVRMGGFQNVPAPVVENVKVVAYVFRLSSKPTDRFSLPSAASAVTPETTGDIGYSFYLPTSPGNFTIYALAGLEDRSTSPAVFTPYAMGLTRGVAVGPNDTQSDVYIQIDLPLDHTLRVNAKGPKPTSRGPDRLEAKLAIEVGSEGYVLLPNGLLSSLLPAEESFDFVGIPPLTGSLTGTRYVATALAATGESEGTPRSAVGLFATTTDTNPIGVDEFIEVPQLKSPASSSVWDRTTFELEQVPGGPEPDLTVIDVSSGNDLVTWRIVAPGTPEHIEVPDLRAIDDELGLIPGVIAINVKLARIPDFSYDNLATAKLSKGWSAYAEDVFFASY